MRPVSNQVEPRPSHCFLHATVGLVVFLAAWCSTTWVFFFGLWVLVIGDRESKLFWLAPVSGAVVAGGALAYFRHLSKKGLWRALTLTLVGTFVCAFAAWRLILLIDEG